MADTTISPNMNLPIPIVGQDPGPQYATDVNSCLTLVDGHNHSSGSGVQITPNGININADLSFNSNNAIALKSTRFTALGTPLAGSSPNLDCLYVSGVDLYYNDGNGNQVRITQSGGVAGSPGSIANLTSPASASYVAVSSTFVWQSAANTPANMDAGSYIFRNITANSHGVTVNAPSALGSDYSLTLPAIPVSSSIMTLDTSGNIGSTPLDNVTIVNSGGVIKVGTIPSGSITANYVSSSGSGTFTTSSPTAGNITNLTVTITTHGNPVVLTMIPDPSVASSTLQYIQQSSTAQGYITYLLNPSTILTQHLLQSLGGTTSIPVSSFSTIHFVSAGTYTYLVQGSCSGGTLTVNNAVLVAYEL